MTDLEICKRIAEIERVKLYGNSLTIEGTLSHVHDDNELGYNLQYNPLTDKALCFDLMVKHDVRVEPSDCNAWLDNEDGYPEHEVIHHDGTLQEAICLAIIEAHKENT
jgi:hypothetical protein